MMGDRFTQPVVLLYPSLEIESEGNCGNHDARESGAVKEPGGL